MLEVKNIMGGWKTWTAAGAFFLLGAVDVANGDIEAGLAKITFALGLIGIGHKIEKSK